MFERLFAPAAVLLAWMALAPQSGDCQAAGRPGIADPKPPYSIEKLRDWRHEFPDWPWGYPPEQKVRLRSGGLPQLLVCSGGGARSGRFILFGKRKNGWSPISGEIDQAHHPIRVLSHAVSGWHDFETFLPLWGSGRREVTRVRYRWTGRRYRELSASTGAWCDFEPFKSDKGVCRH